MKIIEAMKQVKANKQKIFDLQVKIKQNCVNLSYETPQYPNTEAQIKEWIQACLDLSQDNVKLLVAIARTNNATNVAIELGGKTVTKSIAEWVWRRREYAALDLMTYSQLTDRGLKDTHIVPPGSTVATEVKVVRHFDPVKRDEKLDMYRNEAHKIDTTLEIVNAVTDLVE